jgi:hypothetical protein
VGFLAGADAAAIDILIPTFRGHEAIPCLVALPFGVCTSYPSQDERGGRSDHRDRRLVNPIAFQERPSPARFPISSTELMFRTSIHP